MIGISGFSYSSDHIYDAARDNIHEVISLISGLMCNYAAVCGGSMALKIVVRDLFERWKSLESKSVMMFSVPLMCWYYRDTSFITKVHPRHRGTM